MPGERPSLITKRRSNVRRPTRKSERLQRKNTTNFEYVPLKSGQIRVLQLSSGRKGDAFVGRLITTQLDHDTMEYDALSYMWGDPTPVDVIWLAGKALPIASNLARALAHLRYEAKSLMIWIDAICIDQKNNYELAEQVQRMRRVYKSAKMVRVWIHEPGLDQTSKAMLSLQKFRQKEEIGVGHEDVYDSDDTSLGDDPAFWEPVLPLFGNAYWKRAWYVLLPSWSMQILP